MIGNPTWHWTACLWWTTETKPLENIGLPCRKSERMPNYHRLVAKFEIHIFDVWTDLVQCRWVKLVRCAQVLASTVRRTVCRR